MLFVVDHVEISKGALRSRESFSVLKELKS